ncbi:alpha-glucosidase [Martelella mediterranea]|uniref:Alpha-glucosidase n=1 Tax=Martelella mediterranea TaxID=293089 RepID=A0A4R3NVZ3_9HYPH|nr:alpha-glucosidase [Martelella mediterranea]TCT42165.1 alpha-glucosidase [Martelella mediterranea]
MQQRTNDGANWWRGGVIYQIYPRSFQDTTGDGIGDLKGITKRLGYVAELGVDAIWLSPFFTSPMEDMGYDVSDYCGVDPMFGTLNDFDELVSEAHRLGLKVVIDQVLSHTSDRHQWFEESRQSKDNDKADWYVWADAKPDGTAPNNWLSVFGGPAWEWDGVRKQYYMHNFLASQPDLNFHSKAVQDALLETVRFWLERGVDGFRLDTVNYYFCDKELRDNPPVDGNLGPTGLDAPDVNPYGFQQHEYDKTRPENVAFLQRFRALLDQYDGRASVGEVGDGARSLKTVADYTSGGDKLHMCYTFDFLGPEFTPFHIRKCVEDFFSTVEDGWVCWAFSNHDVDRHASRFAKSEAERAPVARLALSVIATLRGSVCLYQGEELGLPQAELTYEDLQDPYGIRFWPSFKGRDGCRTPMPWSAKQAHAGFTTADKPWLPVPDAHLPLSVFEQAGEPASVYNHYRAILSFRKAHSALFDGAIAFKESGDDDILVFTRSDDHETLLFAFNFASKPKSVALPTVMSHLDTLDLPGATAVLNDTHIDFGAFDGFCARIQD